MSKPHSLNDARNRSTEPHECLKVLQAGVVPEGGNRAHVEARDRRAPEVDRQCIRLLVTQRRLDPRPTLHRRFP